MQRNISSMKNTERKRQKAQQYNVEPSFLLNFNLQKVVFFCLYFAQKTILFMSI